MRKRAQIRAGDDEEPAPTGNPQKIGNFRLHRTDRGVSGSVRYLTVINGGHGTHLKFAL